MLSVHMNVNVFDTGMVRCLRRSSFKPVASNAACSLSLGMESAFMGATLVSPKTKATCVSSEYSTRARRKATAQKTSSELPPKMCQTGVPGKKNYLDING